MSIINPHNILKPLVLAGVLIAGVNTSSASLTWDLRAVSAQGAGVAVNGPKSVEIDPGSTGAITFQMFAVVVGTAAGPESFQSGRFSLLSSNVGLRGNLGGLTLVENNYNASGSQTGLVNDLDGDGDLDIGGVASLSAPATSADLAKYIVPRSASSQGAPPGTVIPNGMEILFGTVTFTLTGAGAGDSSVNFFIPGFVSAPTANASRGSWTDDGGIRNGGTSQTPPANLLVGAPVSLVLIPEPSVAVTLLGGVATLLGFRRRKH